MTMEEKSNGVEMKTNSFPSNVNEFPMTKFQILRNLVVISFGFCFLFTAFQSLTNLQSTLNKDEGVGVGG